MKEKADLRNKMCENAIERRLIDKVREKRNYQVKKTLGKMNYQEKKAQMVERRKTSLWLNTKLIELELKYSDNKEVGKNETTGKKSGNIKGKIESLE